MELNRSLDLLIKATETNQDIESTGFSLNGRIYNSYMDNKSWLEFCCDMQTNYPSAFKSYGEGSGDELGIKNKFRTPPKMAFYGSSSRMIYLHSRDIPNFKFEEKLPTTVGGTAHMDGHITKGNTDIYIEAKCREPYSKKNFIIDTKYKHLYEFISSSADSNIKCRIEEIGNGKMKVTFSAGEITITTFDVKQMISHLLGIATRYLKSNSSNDILFLYFLYNPKFLDITDGKLKNEIYAIYDTEMRECESINFEQLFKVILTYLQNIISSDLDVDKCAGSFSFKCCDQTTYKKYIANI